jgi:hypothetical protein
MVTLPEEDFDLSKGFEGFRCWLDWASMIITRPTISNFCRIFANFGLEST